jgi:hypothetical protein
VSAIIFPAENRICGFPIISYRSRLAARARDMRMNAAENSIAQLHKYSNTHYLSSCIHCPALSLLQKGYAEKNAQGLDGRKTCDDFRIVSFFLQKIASAAFPSLATARGSLPVRVT